MFQKMINGYIFYFLGQLFSGQLFELFAREMNLKKQSSVGHPTALETPNLDTLCLVELGLNILRGLLKLNHIRGFTVGYYHRNIF